jgi:hypothetical protein
MQDQIIGIFFEIFVFREANRISEKRPLVAVKGGNQNKEQSKK